MKCKENIVSNQPLANWRGSETFFKGFTGTTPTQEIENADWAGITKAISPEQPQITVDKKQGKYFVPCSLKEAPLVGNTLKYAEQHGKPTIGRMRSKDHVTEASMLVMDVDGLPDEIVQAAICKMKAEGITYSAYSSYSHGNPNKPGNRVRIIVPLDKPVGIDEYRQAYHGFDQYYFDGQITKADSSGAQLYQQQGAWMTSPDWQDKAFKDQNEAGVASASALIEIGQPLLPVQAEKALIARENKVDKSDYHPSSANKVADRCDQIKLFRDNKGAEQSEPLWTDCLGVVGHCENGQEVAHEWSSGHQGYNWEVTQKKLDHRLQYGPTTCEQFKKTNPQDCEGCQENCNSPITLGWPDNKEQVKKQKEKKSIALFDEVEAWTKPVEPRELISGITSLIHKHIILSKEQGLAVTLWILLTWVIGYVDVLALLIINAPERACGKTHLLDVINRLARCSLSVASISSGALYRLIEAYEPTLLIDEADMFMNKNADQAGLINAGQTRTSARAVRCVGDKHEPNVFSLWAPKALAGIALERHLPESTLSRGIVIHMRRKRSEEKVERIRSTSECEFQELKRKCLRFSNDYGTKIASMYPDLPNALDDRQQDNWEPLLAIASLASSDVLEQAMHAAVVLSSKEDHLSIRVELLIHIRDVFEGRNVDKLQTSELIEALCEDEEAPWGAYHHGKPITARQLGQMLKEFRIHSRTLKFNRNSLKGYQRVDFEDAFARYIPASTPEDLPLPRNSPLEAMPAKGFEVTDHTSPIRNGNGGSKTQISLPDDDDGVY